jgi:Tfp pilus assembly protein PilX
MMWMLVARFNCSTLRVVSSMAKETEVCEHPWGAQLWGVKSRAKQIEVGGEGVEKTVVGGPALNRAQARKWPVLKVPRLRCCRSGGYLQYDPFFFFSFSGGRPQRGAGIIIKLVVAIVVMVVVMMLIEVTIHYRRGPCLVYDKK